MCVLGSWLCLYMCRARVPKQKRKKNKNKNTWTGQTILFISFLFFCAKSWKRNFCLLLVFFFLAPCCCGAGAGACNIQRYAELSCVVFLLRNGFGEFNVVKCLPYVLVHSFKGLFKKGKKFLYKMVRDGWRAW